MASGQDEPLAPYGGRPWRRDEDRRDLRAHEGEEGSADGGFFDGPAPEDGHEGEGRAFGPDGPRDRGEAPTAWRRSDPRGPGQTAYGRAPDRRSPRGPEPASERPARVGDWPREAASAARGRDDRYGFDAFGVPSDYNYCGGRPPADGDVSSDRVRPGQERGPAPFGSERDVWEDRQRARGRPDGRPYGEAQDGRARGPQTAPRRTVWEEVRDEVSAWLGDEGAARRRLQDEETHRGRGPANYVRSDARVKEDVCDLLSEDPMLDASAIEVKVEACEVTLDGRVRRREDKRRAEDLAERVYGVAHVQNNLRLAEDEGQAAARP